MKIAYIVAAHQRVDQLERLVRRLADEDTSFVVHVDRRAGAAPYDDLRRRMADLDRVHFLDRHLGFWGGFGVVRAALKGIRVLVEEDIPFDYAALLSGQDYPLRPPEAIRDELQRAAGRSFMSYHRLPFDGWGPRGGFNRVEDWHLVSHVALHVRLPWKRRVPGGLAPYGGGRSWLLERRVVAYVDEFVRANPELVTFFEHALHPDELFFQTLLLNSPFADTIVNDHRQYVEWRGGANPATLTCADLDKLVASDCLFARKFDVTVDSAVLDKLDEHLEATHRAAAC